MPLKVPSSASPLPGAADFSGSLKPNAELIIVGEDDKAARWAEECTVRGYSVSSVRWSTQALRALIRSRLAGRPPATVMLRYMNDSPRLRLSLLKALQDVILVGAARMLGGRIFWLCHNVDRETRQFYPRLTAVRRRCVGNAAAVIFVTDPLLVEPAKRMLPKTWAPKVAWLCFGPFASWGDLETWGSGTEPEVRRATMEFASRFRSNAHAAGKVPLIGLCLGRTGDKYLHFDYAADLLDATACGRFHLGLIVATDVTKLNSRQRASIEAVRSSGRGLVFDRPVGFSEPEMADHFDFVWRVCDDQSTPVTVYGAAATGKPILTLDTGFVSVLIKRYRLGAILPPAMTGLDEALSALAAWEASGAAEFLSERGWDKAAGQLCTHLAVPGA